MQKYAHDGAGRLTAGYLSDGGGDAGWADAFSVTGDIVLGQAEYAYDANGNVIGVTSRQRFHDEAGTGRWATRRPARRRGCTTRASGTTRWTG